MGKLVGGEDVGAEVGAFTKSNSPIMIAADRMRLIESTVCRLEIIIGVFRRNYRE